MINFVSDCNCLEAPKKLIEMDIMDTFFLGDCQVPFNLIICDKSFLMNF